jgi:hypothetical protein
MAVRELSRLAACIEELRRDWPVLIANEDLGQRFQTLLDDVGLKDVLEEVDFAVPGIA